MWPDPISAVCALWNFGLAGWCLYPSARGCRAPRRMRPKLAAKAPAISVWRYRLVAGAAELGGSVADRGACNNAVRESRRSMLDARFLVRARGAAACVRSGSISGWGDRALDPWACGRRTARGTMKGNKATANQSPWLKLPLSKTVRFQRNVYASAIGLCKDSCLIAKGKCL